MVKSEAFARASRLRKSILSAPETLFARGSFPDYSTAALFRKQSNAALRSAHSAFRPSVITMDCRIGLRSKSSPQGKCLPVDDAHFTAHGSKQRVFDLEAAVDARRKIESHLFVYFASFCSNPLLSFCNARFN